MGLLTWFGRRREVQVQRVSRRRYDAAQADWAAYWRASTATPHREIAHDLDTLRARARDLERNRPYGRRILDAMVDALVGTGIRPTVDGAPAALYDLWTAWGRACVSGARIGYSGAIALAVRTWLRDGEVLIRLRTRYPTDMPGLPPLQLQLIEADHLPVELDQDLPGGRTIRSGIEFDPIGRVAAYHLLREHPGSGRPSRETIRVPADEIIHLYLPERPGQIRGVPILASAILPIWDLSSALEAVRVSFRGSSTIVAVVEGGSQEAGIAPDGIAEERDGPDPVTDAAGRAIEGLQPGLVIYAPDGRQVRIHQPQPPQGLTDYCRAMLREIAASVGLSYHVLSGDMSDASFACAKLGLLAQQQRMDVLRETVIVPSLLDPIWSAYLDHAQAAGLLRVQEPWRRVRWSRPAYPTADRYQEARATLLEIRSGLRSRTSAIEAMGRDPDEVDAEIAADAARADSLGLILDSDPRRTTLAGSAAMHEEVQP